jgi:hypothetical protein
MWAHLASTRFVGEVGFGYVTSDLGLRRKQRDVFSAILSRCADYSCSDVTHPDCFALGFVAASTFAVSDSWTYLARAFFNT